MEDFTFKSAPQSPTELPKILERFQNQSQTLQDYLSLLSILPALIQLKWGFQPGTQDEINEFERLFWLQTAKAEWLDYLITQSQAANPQEVPIPPELVNSEKKVVEVRAKLSKAVLDLTRFTFEWEPLIKTTERPTPKALLKTANRPTPESIWFAWELQNFENMLEFSGLITGKATYQESKVTVDARCRALAKILETANPRTLPLSTTNVSYADDLLGDLEVLLCCAYREAVEDIRFRNSKAYIGFQRALRAWSRECRRNPFWILPQFENGKRLPTGRNAKRVPNRINPDSVT